MAALAFDEFGNTYIASPSTNNYSYESKISVCYQNYLDKQSLIKCIENIDSNSVASTDAPVIEPEIVQNSPPPASENGQTCLFPGPVLGCADPLAIPLHKKASDSTPTPNTASPSASESDSPKLEAMILSTCIGTPTEGCFYIPADSKKPARKFHDGKWIDCGFNLGIPCN
jgi:hypothetical protein